MASLRGNEIHITHVLRDIFDFYPLRLMLFPEITLIQMRMKHPVRARARARAKRRNIYIYVRVVSLKRNDDPKNHPSV